MMASHPSMPKKCKKRNFYILSLEEKRRVVPSCSDSKNNGKRLRKKKEALWKKELKLNRKFD